MALTIAIALGYFSLASAQTPTISVRFANPSYECSVSQYCLDVEFMTPDANVELFGMNVRFFYPDAIMELDSFTDFQGGYGPVSPDPPQVLQSGAGFGTTFFGFPAPGVTDWVNGAIQLVDNSQPQIILSTTWTKIFQICFTVQGPIADSTSFCPPIVWDLELNPANGGYLAGDDGVVMTVVAPPPSMSNPSNENVVQFNWMYTGNGNAPPYGAPIPTECISLFCTPTITCPADLTIDCSASTLPANTGTATATSTCITQITIDYSDLTIGSPLCGQEFVINRTWIATNDCGEADTCVQVITVVDNTPPVVTCPDDIVIQCTDSTDPSFTGTAVAVDACDPAPSVTYIDVTVAGACPQEYTIDRIWIAADACGNTNLLCRQRIDIVDDTPPVITCPPDLTLECSDPIPTDTATAVDNCGPVDSIAISYQDILCENPIMGFNGIYDFANWSIITPSGGAVVPMGDTTVMLESPDGNIPCPLGASVYFQIVIPSTGQLAFDWSYVSNDVDGPLYDPFGYNLNGTFYQLTDDNGALTQSGTASVAVTAGDIFAFEQNSIDCILGEGASTVVEFFACIEQTAETCTELIIRTHTATDQCGNSSNCVQTIYIQDTTAPTITCPANITIECTDSTLPATTGNATATDNCDLTLPITYNDITVASMTCPQEYTITRTFSTVDACGNTAACVQTIVVDDSTAPVITLCPANITIECTASTLPANTGNATATDNCDPAPVVTFSDVTTASMVCPQEYTINRTWTATDACGNSSTCGQVITIDDSTPPTITFCPANITIECDESTDPMNTGLASATDNCDPVPAVTYNDVTTASMTCPQEYTINRTWTATDDCGNSSTCAQVITVDDSTPPVITLCPPNITIECTASTDPANTGNATATDNCDPAPAVTYNDVTTASMTCPQEYTINRTWTATDACGNSSTCGQTIVVDDSTPPVITCPINITIECTDSTDPTNTGSASATDNCDLVPTITYSDATIASTVCPQEYTINRTWTATDDCGNSSTCLQVIIVDDSTPPVITLCPANITIECTESTAPANTGNATASDNCDPAPSVTFNDVTTASQICPQEYTINRTWIATDACGNSSTCTQIITIDDSTPPVITLCPANITIECDESTDPMNTGLASATDNCDPAPVVTYNDVTTASMTCPQEYTINRTWTATDACGNSSTCAQVITVDDSTPPVITLCPPNITIECTASTDPSNTGNATATDNCDPAPVVTYNDVTTASMICPQEYTIDRTWTATDACGNSSTCAQIITIDDSTPPSIVCPIDVTIECDQSTLPANTGSATASDNCDASPEITYSDVTTAGNCPQAYTISRTWVATDTCGNSSNCVQIIVVEDTTPPDLTCVPNVTIECDESTDPANTGQASATDNCDPVADVTYTDAIVPGACPQELTITRSWTAVDDCGNVSNCTQVIEVVDSTPPTITFCPAGTTLECDQSTDPDNTGIASATDNCDVAPVVTHNDVITPGSCPQSYTIDRTWVATDACGNSSTCLQTIIVEDTTPPVITCPVNVTIECDESTDPQNTGVASATDNCSDTQIVFGYSGGLQTFTVPDGVTSVVITAFGAQGASGTGTAGGPGALGGQAGGQLAVTPGQILNIFVGGAASGQAGGYNGGGTGGGATGFGDPAPGNGGGGGGASDVRLGGTALTDRVLVAGGGGGGGAMGCEVASTGGAGGAGGGLAGANGADTPTSGGVAGGGQGGTVGVGGAAGIGCNYALGSAGLADGSGGHGQMCCCFSVPHIPAGGGGGGGYVTGGGGGGGSAGTTACSGNDKGAGGGGAGGSSYTGGVVAPFIANGVNAGNGSVIISFTVPVDVTFAQSVVPGGCPQESIITRTWIATDACGNSSTCAQTITVDDSTPPVITLCPANITVECDESTDPANTGSATASDNCDPAPAVDFNDVTTGGACPQEYTINRTWLATDACGNSSTCLQIVTIEDTTPPLITCPIDVTIECDQSTLPANTGTASATDNCDQAPAIDYADVTFGIGEGGCPQEYRIERTWTSTDACGNSSTCLQNILILDTTPPVITCPVDTIIECNTDPSPESTGFATATDNCTLLPFVNWSDVTVASQTCPQEYTITRTWTAQDDCGNLSSCVQTVVIDDSTPPVITCPQDITVDCNDSTDPEFTGFGSASDNCDQAPVVDYSDVTIDDTCPKIYERTWTATDACGNVSSCVQTITKDDTTPPAIICPPGVTVQCASDVPPVLTGGVTVSDNCGFVTVTHGGDNITNMTCTNRFDISRVYIATDECGNSSTCAQIIVVFDNTPPTITCPAPITVSCASNVPAPSTGSVTASDNCAGAVTITHVGDAISNQTCVNRFTLTRTYRATDVCGNSATCTQIITVFDNTPPTITCPAPVTVSCASQVPPVNTGSVVTSDNCGGTVTVTHVGDVVTNQTCVNRFTLTRTYRATDACGNSATCAQVITVFDNTPPAITCPANITINFGDNTLPANTGNPTGSDNCGGTPTYSSTDVIIPGICEQEFVINRTWTATDACGNTATCLQVITVDGQCIVDLNLTKVYIDAGPVEPGDDINFVITVCNQGEVSAGSITITDYIPIGFHLNDPDWTPGNQGSTGQSASIVLSIANGGLDANGLNPGECVAVIITLQADADLQPGLYVNTAEISFVYDVNGNDITDEDIDSDPDQNDTNDPPGEDDIDVAEICVLPHPFIVGDGYVCPEEVTTYTVEPYNPDWTYVWNLNGGGQIIADNGSNVQIQWQEEPGGPFELSVTVILGNNCQTTTYFFVYIQGVETLTCNDNVQISLGPDCEAVVLSGMILEGEAEGNNNYFVVITDQNGNVIPDATLTSEHIGQCFMVSVQNECNDQSCWGTICVEDKIKPVIECADVTVSCGTDLDPVYEPPVTGSISQTVPSGLPIGPNGGTVTNQEIILDVPANAVVTDVNITVDLVHTWVGDLTAELISPSGTTVLLLNQLCGSVNDWDHVTFDDEAGIAVPTACNPLPPALAGAVIPQGALSAIDGQSAVGPWTLRITDQVGGDGGVLNEVTLNVDYYLAVPSAPYAYDACGEVTLTYTETQSGDACDEQILTRTWTATDGSGNTSTCVQNISITPLTLDNVDFPEAYVGVCGESAHPNHTGWPTVDGTPITDENDLCNIFVGYWDKELNECGGGRKIVRTWTVLDWCQVELVEAVQVIKLMDNEGPVLTCPADYEVGTDFWYCYANVSVPKPQAVDNCSEIASYSLISTDGIVVSFGNNYVINGLELGTHTVTWIVTDECGNSSSCTFHITVVDDVVPVANCDQHTIVSLTNDGPSGITLVPASVFDDGSYDNCGPVTFRARRMDSCIDFDWTTEGACIDDHPGGIPAVNSRDRGTVHRPCVPFACCDVGNGPVMVELEVTDAAGNVNYCMVEAEIQDKISPFVECPPDIIVSCDFWFNVQEGTFVDGEGNNNGSLDEDPLSAVFGNMFDAYRYDESARENIVINDPGNEDYSQPHNWGIDGWADDNCEVNLQVRVRIVDDCSGGDLPGNAPDGAVKLIERRFSASDGNEGIAPGTCTQRIWVVDYDPFFITDNTCNNSNPNDGVIWPCDVLLTTCPEDLGNTGEPTVFDDACSLIGVTYEDQRFDFVDGACFKILRDWAVIDWCQYNPQTGAGLWHYTQVIKVHDEDGPAFVDACETQVLCVADDGVSLPDNNQAFLGENNPLASSCSVHLNLSRTVHETCSDIVNYDVKLYPFNGTDFIYLKTTAQATVDENNDAVLTFNTRQNSIKDIRDNGIPYNSVSCGDYHRILWSVEDGCGNWSHCEYLIRLEDCKQPSPVCINGLSTVVMPIGGQVTVWAKDFNASSYDDCTPAADLLYSFSGDSYQPSFTYTCDNVPAFNVELPVSIWVADGGTDDNCNGQISWNERNKDFCTTTIVITDNNDVCGGSGSILAGDILTDHTNAVGQVKVNLTSPNHVFPQYITAQNGHFVFNSVPLGEDYFITPERNDDHRNGVSTLDLVRIQKHLLGKELFTTPYQYIAADANNTQSVSAIDLVELRKLILGIYSELPNNQSWRFVDKAFPMEADNPWPFSEEIALPGLANDSIMHNDFVGVKIGDVNNSAKANVSQVLPRGARRVLQIEMDALPEVKAGEVINVKLRIPEYVEGFQWTLETEGLNFVEIGSERLDINEGNVGVLENGVVTMSWNAVSAQEKEDIQEINLRFVATNSGNIAEMIHLTSRITEAEAYTLQGEIVDVKLAYSGMAPEFALYQNKPNPWNNQTTIGFDLPGDAPVTLTVFEATGKVVKTIERDGKAGYNTITLTANELPAAGVMYYRLESGEYSASKKMVLLK